MPFQLGGFQRGEEIGIFPPLACFLFLSTFSWARGHERLPPVSALFRGFLSRLACWASAQRRSLGATIPRKMSAHRCCTVFTEQICDESRRRPRIILSYSQGLQRRVGANLPAKTDRGSCPLAPARAKRKWTPTRQNRRVKRAADSCPYILWSAEGKTTSPAMRKKAGKSAKKLLAFARPLCYYIKAVYLPGR